MIKESLFQLIQSMTMSEKRHFKIYASKHVIGGNNDYVRLFDAIAAQEDYDDGALLEADFVKNLPAEKYYLQNLIMRSLNVFHDRSSAKTTIYSLLHSIDILYHKGLYDQALRLVKKAKKIAKDNELFVQGLAVSEIEVELLSKQFEYGLASEEIVKSQDLIEDLMNFRTLQKVTTDCYKARLEIGTSRSDADSKRLEKFLQKDGVGEKDYPSTKRAEMYQNGLNLTYTYFVGDDQKSMDYTTQMTTLYEENPHLIEYSTIGYVSSLYNLHNAYLARGQKDLAEETLLKLEASKDKYGIPTSDNIGARVYYYSMNIRLNYYLKNDRYEEVEKILQERGRDEKRFGRKIGKPQLYEYYFLRAKYAFVTGKFKQALKYTNSILNDLNFKVRADLLSAVRLLNLLIHYELRNDFTLEYLAKNTMSYLRKKERLFKVEAELIKFITNYHKANSLKEQLADLQQLESAMSQLKKDKYERIPFDLFDFERWAKAKIQNRSLLSYSQ